MSLDWTERRVHVIEVATAAGFAEADAEAVALASRPAARLVATPDRLAEVGVSKLGGLPDLPSDVPWPTGQHGPMTFLGQVDTAQTAFLCGVEAWPATRVLLSFFADKDPDSDAVEQGARAGIVLACRPASIIRHERPADLHGRSLLPESPFDARPVMTPPMFFDVVSGIELEHDLDADNWAAWERLYEGLGCGEASITAGHHQLLGRAWGGDMDAVWMGGVMLSEAGEDPDDPNHPFRLLAQFTTDHDAGVEFADAGSIYFVGRVHDLAAHRFDRIAVVMHTH